MAIKQEYLELIKEFRLMDDDFFTVCLDNNIDAVELMLKIILDRDDLKVKSVHTQDTLESVGYRSVRLDIHAFGSDGKEYDIEIQRSNEGAVP